jgi:hypothetical protein
MSNLAIWNAVERTDPKYTKSFARGGGFRGTAINATYLAKCATEKFGPCGLGWGVSVLDERVLDGAEGEKVHRVHVKLWYEWDGKRGEVEHFGQTTFVGKNKHGWFTDEEAPKKSLTDAMSKALSLLGFGSDVHLGLYDDSKYLNDLKREFAEAKAGSDPDGSSDRKAIRSAAGKQGNEYLNEDERDKAFAREIRADPQLDELCGVPPKSSAQAKRDGDWGKLEASLAQCADSAAVLDWPALHWTVISRLNGNWREQILELWRKAVADVIAADCQTPAEVKHWGVVHAERLEKLAGDFLKAARDVATETLRHLREAAERQAAE